MTHPPQEVLLKVMCSERLPEDSVLTNMGINWTNADGVWPLFPNPTIWYEPATRIVLTEEEYMEMSIKANRYDQSQQAMKNT